MIAPPWNARTRVHEYGGGSLAVAGGIACFSHLPDQRVYRLDGASAPRPLTPPGSWRYADGVIDRRRGALIAVGEEHREDREPRNCLVRIDLDGREAPVVLASGHDFYAAPRLSPDGGSLAWIAWRHPDMPWDASELWTARVDEAGGLRDARLIAGGRGESAIEPAWSPQGALHWVSDRSGWWNLHRLDGDRSAALRPMEAEFARPPWLLGGAHYDFLEDGTILCAYGQDGRWHLGRLDPRDGALTADSRSVHRDRARARRTRWGGLPGRDAHGAVGRGPPRHDHRCMHASSARPAACRSMRPWSRCRSRSRSPAPADAPRTASSTGHRVRTTKGRPAPGRR